MEREAYFIFSIKPEKTTADVLNIGSSLRINKNQQILLFLYTETLFRNSLGRYFPENFSPKEVKI